MNRIIDKILKKILKDKYLSQSIIEEHKEKEENFIENVIKKSKFGDIIWAYRYDYDWDKERIDESHEKGPFIVIGKTENKLICTYCTSVENKKEFFKVGATYKLFKNGKPTYTSITKIKTIDYLSYISSNANYGCLSLDKEDETRLLKHLKLNKTVTYEDLGLIFDLDIDKDISLDVKDVVLYHGKYYLIIDKIEDKFIFLDIKNYNPANTDINFTDINIANICKLKKNDFTYINTISNKNYITIMKLYNYYLKKEKEVKENETPTRGSVIEINKKYYYVYGSEKNDLLTFEVKYSNNKYDEVINVGKSKFKPDFDNIKIISTNDKNYKIITIATDRQMDEIKEIKKHYTKENKIQSKNKKSKNKNKNKTYDFGDIIYTDELFGMKFLVLYINGNEVIALSLDALISGNYIYRTLNKQKTKKYYETTTQEKLWLESNLEDIKSKYSIHFRVLDYIYRTSLEIKDIDISCSKEQYKIKYYNIGTRVILSNEDYYKLLDRNPNFLLEYSIKDKNNETTLKKKYINIASIINNYTIKRNYFVRKK